MLSGRGRPDAPARVLLERLEETWTERVGTGRYREFRAVLDEIAGLR